MAVKKITNVKEICAKVVGLQKDFAKKAADNAADQSKGSVEMFLKSIGDNALKLKDNIFEDKIRAILLLFVNDFDSDSYKVLAVCFNKQRKVITEITLFNYHNLNQIEDYIGDKILGNDYIGKIADVCRNACCTYSFEGNIIFYIGENADMRIKVADLNKYAVDKVMDILNDAEQGNDEIYEMVLDDTQYAAINKKCVFDRLGSNKCCICSILAKLGFIYTDLGGKKTRCYYRERIKDENGEKLETKYFAINLEKLAAAIMGGE